MTEENKNQNIDFNTLKSEILESNKNLMESLKDNILFQVKTTLDTHANETKNVNDSQAKGITNEALTDFASEIDQLNLDETQASALVKMMSKVLNKNTSTLKDQLFNDVSESIDQKQLAKDTASDMFRMFPDLKNNNSALFKEAKVVLSTMSKKARSAPEAEAFAVERAALRLGIQPKTLKDINAWDAQNPMGGDDSSPKKKGKEIDPDIAKMFGIDPKKVNEKMREKGYLQ